MVVGLFALLGFVYVPLGHKTGFEHLKAIARTGAAQEAARDLAEAAIWARARLLGALTGTDADEEPAGHPPAREKGGPKPTVPRLGTD
jgi:hypothetical protein